MTSVSVGKIDDFPAIGDIEEVSLFFSAGEFTIYHFPSTKESIITQHSLYPVNYYDNLKKQSLL